MAAAALLAASPSWAQPASEAPPEPARAMEVFQAVQGWLRAWDGPGDAALPAVPAAAVTIRIDGAVIGRGVDVAPSGAEAGTIARAYARAFEEAARRAPVERDALFEESAREAAQRMTISLELSGALVPIAPAEYSDATVDLAPGLDGVAARIGDRGAAMFPETMIATATDAGSALRSLVANLTDDPSMGVKQPVDLRAETGAAFYRFRTVHLAQPGPGRGPVFLHRGGRAASMSEMDSAGLAAMAGGIAGHLMERRWPNDAERLGLMGDFRPVAAVYEPAIAPAADQAIAALALWRYGGMPGVDPHAASRARGIAVMLLEDLAAVQEGAEQAPWADAAASAAAVGACLEIDAGVRDTSADLSMLLERCGARLGGAFGRETGFAAEVPPGARGMVAWALVRLDRAAGEAAVRTVFRDTPPEMLVGQMPWLGWSEIEFAGPGGEVGAAVALREMRAAAWRFQISALDVGLDDRDLVGGIRFTAAPAVLPDWHTARPVAAFATMLRVPSLTEPTEAPAELFRLLASLRFLRQLAADEAAGHMYGAPERAMWGVRSSVWDQRMPLDASSLTLLAVCETVESLAAQARPER